MRPLLALAGGVLRLELKDRSTYIWMLVMPMVFIAFFGGMFSSQGVNKARLTVVDGDQTFLSGALVDALRTDDLDLSVIKPAEVDTTKERVRTLSIPKGFADSLETGQRVGILLSPGKQSNAEYDEAARIAVYKAMARMLATLAEMDTIST